MSAHKEQAEVLLRAGMRDLLTLQLLNETGRAPHEAIGFHAQQACEKFMKVMLVLQGIAFERTHDLIVIYGLLEQNQIAIPAEKEKLRALNSYAVQFRYEGCPIEMVASIECQTIASILSKWAGGEYEKGSGISPDEMVSYTP
jgi:HEPN domain-containing protein